MIRIVETPVNSIEYIYSEEGETSEAEVLLHTIIETFDDVEIEVVDEEGKATTEIISTRLELKRLMPNGDEYIITDNIEQYIPFGTDVLDSLKQSKLEALNYSAKEALKTFTFSHDLTFELSGESKSNLIFVQNQIQANPDYYVPWFALDGSYNLGDLDNVIINASNIAEFAQAMEDKTNAVFVWKETQKHYLGLANTIEAVKAISTDYPQ